MERSPVIPAETTVNLPTTTNPPGDHISIHEPKQDQLILAQTESVNKPIFGLVENMAWFTPAEHPDEKYYIFGQGGGLRMAEKYNIPLLGQIPIVQSIREGGACIAVWFVK